jgi:hypothetical protein
MGLLLPFRCGRRTDEGDDQGGLLTHSRTSELKRLGRVARQASTEAGLHRGGIAGKGDDARVGLAGDSRWLGMHGRRD